jgi:uncharacterized repeat protein (TIGR02543 family)
VRDEGGGNLTAKPQKYSGEWYVCLRLFDATGDGYADYLWEGTIENAVTTLQFTDFELVDEAGLSTGLTVLFHADGGRPATQTKTVPSGGTVGAGNMPTNPVKAGYAFGGWYSSTDGGGSLFTESTPVTADLTVVYAKWSQTGGGSDFITSVEELKEFLDDPPQEGTLDAPILVRMKVDLADATDGWKEILQAIKDKGKYVDLDVTECQWGTEFDPGTYQTGEPYITGLALPNAAAVTAYTTSSKWGVSDGGKTSVYGGDHKAVTITVVQ